MERLTALAVPARGEPFLVVPRLEAPMVGASPAGTLGLQVVAWDETDDAFAVLAREATGRLGTPPAPVAVGNRTWAEHAPGGPGGPPRPPAAPPAPGRRPPRGG